MNMKENYMKSYKILKKINDSLYTTNRNIYYKLGEMLSLDDMIVPYLNGFHSCKNLKHLFDYETFTSEHVIAEMEIEDYVETTHLYVSRHIKLVRILQIDEVCKLLPLKLQFVYLKGVGYSTAKTIKYMVNNNDMNFTDLAEEVFKLKNYTLDDDVLDCFEYSQILEYLDDLYSNVNLLTDTSFYQKYKSILPNHIKLKFILEYLHLGKYEYLNEYTNIFNNLDCNSAKLLIHGLPYYSKGISDLEVEKNLVIRNYHDVKYNYDGLSYLLNNLPENSNEILNQIKLGHILEGYADHLIHSHFNELNDNILNQLLEMASEKVIPLLDNSLIETYKHKVKSIDVAYLCSQKFHHLRNYFLDVATNSNVLSKNELPCEFIDVLTNEFPDKRNIIYTAKRFGLSNYTDYIENKLDYKQIFLKNISFTYGLNEWLTKWPDDVKLICDNHIDEIEPNYLTPCVVKLILKHCPNIIYSDKWFNYLSLSYCNVKEYLELLPTSELRIYLTAISHDKNKIDIKNLIDLKEIEYLQKNRDGLKWAKNNIENRMQVFNKINKSDILKWLLYFPQDGKYIQWGVK